MKDLKLSLDNGERLLDRLLSEGVDIAHDCGGVLACSSCRVLVLQGMEHFEPASDSELDLLDREEGVVPGARLACQVTGAGELVVRVPYSEGPMPQVLQPILVSDRAAKHFAAQLAKHSGAVAVRLAAVPAGCSGFRYRVDPACTVRSDDHVFESNGVRVVVDAASLPYLHGTILDVVQDGLARHVRFDNPNVRQSCGCGESFGV